MGVTASSMGPLYLWRNVIGSSRKGPPEIMSWDADERGRFIKSGNAHYYSDGVRTDVGGGRVYIFHNTVLQPPAVDGTLPIGVAMAIDTNASDGQAFNMVSRNNIFQIDDAANYAVSDRAVGTDSARNDFDYDLFNGRIKSPATYTNETHGVMGVPEYDVTLANTWFLTGDSPGRDEGTLLPGFNDGDYGSAPDMGAYEGGGGDPLEFGVDAYVEVDVLPELDAGVDGGSTLDGGTGSTLDGGTGVPGLDSGPGALADGGHRRDAGPRHMLTGSGCSVGRSQDSSSLLVFLLVGLAVMAQRSKSGVRSQRT